MTGKPVKVYTYKQALEKAKDYCSRSEKCQSDVSQKLKVWGDFGTDEIDEILITLISESFINEERYSKAFTSGKFKINKWGRRKISYSLFKKGISKYCIKLGLEEIEDSEYLETLEKLFQKKLKQVKGISKFEKLKKVKSYLYQKGFEYDLINSIIDND